MVCLGMAGQTLHASIVYFNDYNLGTDSMGSALSTLPPGEVTQVFTSADFAAALGSGGYSLGIFMVQNYQASDYKRWHHRANHFCEWRRQGHLHGLDSE